MSVESLVSRKLVLELELLVGWVVEVHLCEHLVERVERILARTRAPLKNRLSAGFDGCGESEQAAETR